MNARRKREVLPTPLSFLLESQSFRACHYPNIIVSKKWHGILPTRDLNLLIFTFRINQGEPYHK